MTTSRNDIARNWLLLSLFIMLLIVIGIFIYCSVIDGVYVNKPIIFSYWFNQGIVTHETTQKVYYPGDLVEAKILAVKPKMWPGTIHWVLVDGKRHCYSPRVGVLEAGRNERIVEVERIPNNWPEGDSYFVGYVSFDLNFIRKKIEIPIQSNLFHVRRKGNGL